MKKSFSQLQEIIDSLKGTLDIVFRVFLYKRNGKWILYSGFFDICENSDSAASFSYNYGEFAFIAGSMSETELSGWLSHSQVQLNELVINIPELQKYVHTRVLKSGNLSIFLGVEEPHSVCEISFAHGNQIDEDITLIAKDCPSFLSLKQAAYWFLYDEEIGNNRYSFPDKLSLRWVNDDVWIKKLEIKNEKLHVLIAGKKVKNVRLEIRSGKNFTVDKKLRSNGERIFSLPAELSNEILVILSSDGICVDYEYIKSATRNVVDKDPLNKILETIRAGESEEVEFKEIVPADSEKYLKTVVAFANGKGGAIFFGVEDDTTIKGLQDTFDSVRNRLTEAICDRVQPRPKFYFDRISVGKQHIVILYVESNETYLYGLKKDKRYDIFIRTNSSTRYATPLEIQELSKRERPPLQLNSSNPFYRA